MTNNLVLFRNELKSKYPPKYKITGITVELILSKELFPRNKDLIPFIKSTFHTEFKEYVIASRTNVVARLSRVIESADDDTLFIYKSNLYNFIYSKTANEQYKKNSLKAWKF